MVHRKEEQPHVNYFRRILRQFFTINLVANLLVYKTLKKLRYSWNVLQALIILQSPIPGSFWFRGLRQLRAMMMMMPLQFSRICILFHIQFSGSKHHFFLH